MISWMITALLLSGIFLLWPLYILNDSHDNPSLFGYEALTVLSNSMIPEFEKQDLIIINRNAEPQIGDVVTIERTNELVTHRLIGETDGMYETQGDNNEIKDSQLAAPQDIRGVHSGTIPRFGYVIDFLTSPAGFISLIAVPIAGVGLIEILRKTGNRKNRRNNSSVEKCTSA
ncbi:signal peptidase I [Salisediminibacterium halotolerans]|uniref:signal peptidase I n=1 Tax=Salisediminibacterium halotolerans TaxID=517425 RepID=UPI001F54EF1F|nr:signal peptidase I [Salisediminibacterium halotolerans]